MSCVGEKCSRYNKLIRASQDWEEFESLVERLGFSSLKSAVIVCEGPTANPKSGQLICGSRLKPPKFDDDHEVDKFKQMLNLFNRVSSNMPGIEWAIELPFIEE